MDIETNRMIHIWKTKEAFEGPSTSWSQDGSVGPKLEVVDVQDDVGLRHDALDLYYKCGAASIPAWRGIFN